MLVVPGVMGIGLWSPPLDSLGNSVRGVNFAEVLSLVLYSSLVSYILSLQKFIERFNFHRFDNLVHLSSKIDPRKHR